MKTLPIRTFLLLSLLLLSTQESAAQQQRNPYAPDLPEAGSVEAIARFTTEARFSSPWVSYVPASDKVPSPTKYLGHIVGAPGELSNTSKIYGYMRELDRASERVRVETIGRSEEGRDFRASSVSHLDKEQARLVQFARKFEFLSRSYLFRLVEAYSYHSRLARNLPYAFIRKPARRLAGFIVVQSDNCRP